MDEKVLIGILVMVLLFGVAAFYIHSNGPPKILDKLPLVEEYNPEEIVVVEQAITPSPGSVWKLEQTPSGLMFKQSDSRLVEELELQNVTLQGGDVISWHSSDWYSPGGESPYVSFDTGVLSPVHSVVFRIKMLEPPVVSNTNAMHLMNKGGYGAFRMYWYKGSSGVIELYNGTGVYKGFALFQGAYYDVVNEWHTLAWKSYNALSGVGIEGYIDGVLKNQNTEGGYIAINNTSPLEILGGNSAINMHGYGSYIIVYDTTDVDTSPNHVIDGHKLQFFADASFYNGTHFIALDGTPGTPYGNIQRVPAETIWLWLIKSATTDTNIHVKFMPPGTIIKLKDTVTGQTWEYTVTGVQNQAGLIEDYTITPPTSNPVDITAYVPSERVRFYAPDGFTIKIQDSTGYTTENTIQDGKVTLAGGTTVKLVAQDQKQLTLQLDETPTVYRILVTRSDGTPADAYIWIYDVSGNLVDYGLAENGVYEIAKNPNLPDGIRVEAKALDSGIYYTGSKDFRLAEEQTVTVVPQSGLLSNNNFVIALAAAIFLGMIAIAVIVRGR